MNKKIDLYINKNYICSSTRYKTCKAFKEEVVKDGFVEYTTCLGSGKGIGTIKVNIKKEDKVSCYFSH